MNIDGFLQPKTSCDLAQTWLNIAIKYVWKLGLVFLPFPILSAIQRPVILIRKEKCYLVTILCSYGVVLHLNTFLDKWRNVDKKDE